ncbi:hypothetical protein GCM10023228_19900 [Brevibacillus fulvus]|uniref:Uncharacterized protein n=1 Tax=Brevibacillus fulvus TaxID=1125967 RepID=A0A938XWR3_9BACL|nr:hypothetical protein [Brevibacillus fulvus]
MDEVVYLLFALIISVIAILVVIFMPKRLSKQEVYITWFVMAYVNLTIDLILGHLFDLYDFTGTSKITFHDLVFQATIGPPFGIIFLNFMPKRLSLFLLYLLPVTGFSSLVEWLSLKTNYITFKGWSLLYSVPVYPLGLCFLRWQLHFLRKSKL